MSAPDILTFGCRLNTYESEVMRGHAAGLDDLVIVNTCAVTAEAERQARQAIRRAHRDRPEARIVVTGCAAQLDPARWGALPGVVRVLGNEDKLRPESWSETALGSGDAVSDIMQARETAAHLVTEFAGRSRAFVQVQQGCDHRCTFCIIPFGRGPSRSVPIGAVVEQVRALVGSGYREVVLTGVDITSYGGDLPGRPALGQLARRLLALVPELERLRLSSLDPVEIDEDLWRLIEHEPRLMPHLHLSLQAGSDMVLKRMKRRHLAEDAARVVERARRLRPGIGFGADLIAGFPTEDETFFAETIAFVRDHALPYLHVFPYSERPGTPAARMPAVPVAVRRERAARLREAGAASAASFHAALVGQTLRVLLETPTGGHSEQFAPVRFEAAAGAPGQIVTARILSSDPVGLLGLVFPEPDGTVCDGLGDVGLSAAVSSGRFSVVAAGAGVPAGAGSAGTGISPDVVDAAAVGISPGVGVEDDRPSGILTAAAGAHATVPTDVLAAEPARHSFNYSADLGGLPGTRI